MQRRHLLKLLPAAGLSAGLSACSKKAAVNAQGKPIIRLGHFPNITHTQALIARNLSRQGKGWFEERLGAEITWYVYNAGPSAIEAIFAKAIDATYIGPSPTLNAFAKSKGTEPRILAGAANGGTALIVRPEANITKPEDFRGKRIATPQLGNTQDIQIRSWLIGHGINVTLTGGDATVVPISNADQLGLFLRGELDAVWTAEPFAARLEIEGKGTVFLEDKETNVTMLVGRSGWLQEQPELSQKLTAAHRELTDWVIAHPQEARQLLIEELTIQTTKRPSDAIVDRALARTILTNEVSRPSLEKMVKEAQAAGFLKDIPALDPLLPAP